MRILLTGASGMVGRNILEHPRAKAHAWLSPRRSELNLLDARAVLEYIQQHQPDFIIHAAGHVGGIQANIREPVRFFVDNMDMGRNLLLAARTVGITRLLNLASSCMYPRTAPNPLREDMILAGALEPTNEGYALAKIGVTRLCQYIGREDSRFQYKTLIPCNLYGRWDKFDPSHSHMIPAVIHKLHQAKLLKLATVDIWGDGTARREFMYSGDLADCVLNAIERFDSLPALMNVGPGKDHTIEDYYHTIANIVGYRGKFTHDLSKPTGMKQKLIDASKQRQWGWEPATSLADGIQATYAFYLERVAT